MDDTVPRAGGSRTESGVGRADAVAPLLARRPSTQLRYLDVPAVPDLGKLEPGEPDPYLVCPSCGATMYERGCKLRCRCGYFLSCSDI